MPYSHFYVQANGSLQQACLPAAGFRSGETKQSDSDSEPLDSDDNDEESLSSRRLEPKARVGDIVEVYWQEDAYKGWYPGTVISISDGSTRHPTLKTQKVTRGHAIVDYGKGNQGGRYVHLLNAATHASCSRQGKTETYLRTGSWRPFSDLTESTPSGTNSITATDWGRRAASYAEEGGEDGIEYLEPESGTADSAHRHRTSAFGIGAGRTFVARRRGTCTGAHDSDSEDPGQDGSMDAASGQSRLWKRRRVPAQPASGKGRSARGVEMVRIFPLPSRCFISIK
jgi:hypothetical protein